MKDANLLNNLNNSAKDSKNNNDIGVNTKPSNDLDIKPSYQEKTPSLLNLPINTNLNISSNTQSSNYLKNDLNNKNPKDQAFLNKNSNLNEHKKDYNESNNNPPTLNDFLVIPANSSLDNHNKTKSLTNDTNSLKNQNNISINEAKFLKTSEPNFEKNLLSSNQNYSQSVSNDSKSFLKSKNIFEKESNIIKIKKSNIIGESINNVRLKILNFIIPLLIFLIILLLIIFIIVPFAVNYTKVDNLIKLKSQTYQTLTKKISKLKNISNLQTTFNDYYSKVDKALVSNEQVPELLTVIDHIAKISGLEVLRLSYAFSQDSSKDLNYTSVDVSLNVFGTLDQVTDFFKKIENASRVINIKNFRFSYNVENEKYDVSIVLQSPYLQVNSLAVTDDSIELDIDSNDFINFIKKINLLQYYDPSVLTPVEVIKTEDLESPQSGTQDSQSKDSETPQSSTQDSQAKDSETPQSGTQDSQAKDLESPQSSTQDIQSQDPTKPPIQN